MLRCFSNTYQTWNVRIQFCRIRWKCVVKNLIHVVVIVSSIADVSVLEWNIKKSENETSEVVLESIRTLFDEANVVIPDACIDRAHHVSKTNDTVILRSTTFRHRMFYCNRKTLKGGVTVHLDVTKSRFDLLMKANKYVKDICSVDFEYFDINCRLNVWFENRGEEFFDAMEDLISKIDCSES